MLKKGEDILKEPIEIPECVIEVLENTYNQIKKEAEEKTFRIDDLVP